MLGDAITAERMRLLGAHEEEEIKNRPMHLTKSVAEPT